MSPATFSLRALGLLDQVQILAQLDAFDARRFLAQVAAEVEEDAGATIADVGARLDALGEALAAVDGFAQKIMRIRLTHVLAAAPVTPQFRTLFAATVLKYADDPGLLRRRVADALARASRYDAEEIAGEVAVAADRVLALHAELRAGLLSAAHKLVGQRLPDVERAARDRTTGDVDRRRWGQARHELVATAARPERVAEGTFADRLRAAPEPEEPPEEAAPAGNRFANLEID